MVGIEVRIDGRTHRSLLEGNGVERRRTRRRSTIAMSIAVMVLFVAIMAYVATQVDEADGVFEVAAFYEAIGVCIAMACLGAYTALRTMRARPFVITPQGFTLPRVTLRDGLARRDAFIPLARLTSVLIDRPRLKGTPYPRLRLEYDDERGQHGFLYLDGDDIDDPLEVMMHLKRLAPRTIDASVEPFIREDIGDRENLDSTGQYGSGRRSGIQEGWILILAFVPLVLIPLLIIPETDNLPQSMAVYSVILLGTIFIVYIGVTQYLKYLTLGSSIATSTGITLPRPRWTLFFVRPRSEIPFMDVRLATDGLDADGWNDKARVETWRGETFHVGRPVLRQMIGNPLFAYDGLTLRSAKRPMDDGTRLYEPNYVLLVPLVVGLLLLPLIGAGLRSAIGPSFFLIMAPAMIAIVPLAFIAMAVAIVRLVRGRKTAVSPEMILVPRLWRAPLEVPAEDILEIEAIGGALEPSLRIRTGTGKVRLPVGLAEDLLRNGYPIVDGQGYVGASILNLLESPRPPDRQMDVDGTSMERGELISVEPDKALTRRKREMALGAVVFLFAGSVMFAVFYFVLGLGEEPLPTDLWAMMFLMPSSFFVPSILFLLIPLRMRPQSYYEHGIETQRVMGGMEYVPWSRFRTANETEYKGVRKLNIQGWARAVSVDGSVEHYERIVELVRETLGNKAVKRLGTNANHGEPTRKGWAAHGTDNGSVRARMPRSEIPRRMENRMSVLGLGMGTMMTVAFIFMMLMFAGFPGPGPPLGVPRLDLGDAPLTEINGTLSGENVTLDRPVVVRAGETLSIVDSRLTIGPMGNGTLPIHVEAGGRLEIVNTTMIPNLDGRGFEISIDGAALIDGCNLTYEPALRRFQTGLRTVMVRSDDVVIRNSSFRGRLSAAVAIVNCSPVIQDCLFQNVSAAGIVTVDGSPTVLGSTFDGCTWGVLCLSGNVSVRDCLFVRNLRGMEVWDANASVVGSVFEGNTRAIMYLSGHRPSVLNATFVENTWDFDTTDDIFDGVVMVTVMSMSLIFVIEIVGLSVWRQGRWWEPDLSREGPQKVTT